MHQRFYRVINSKGLVVILNANHIFSMIPFYDNERTRLGFGTGLYVQFTGIDGSKFLSFVPADFDLYSIIREKEHTA